MPKLEVHPFRRGERPPPPAQGFMTLTTVGSGVSTGVPVLGHIDRGDLCGCADAIARPDGPNCRNNVSLLITFPRFDLPSRERAIAAVAANHEKEKGEAAPSHADFSVDLPGNYAGSSPVAHILIDCGKTFRDAYFKVLVPWGLRTVDTVLLTHDHADAVGGLDDLRDLQAMHMVHNTDWVVDSFIPTYLTTATRASLDRSVGYIVKNSIEGGDAAPTREEHDRASALRMRERKQQLDPSGGGWRNIGIRRSTALELITVSDTEPQKVFLPITATMDTVPSRRGGSEEKQNFPDEFPFFTFPVEHGAKYMSMGYVFGYGTVFTSQRKSSTPLERDGSCVVYLSDVSSIPDSSMDFLRDLASIDLLYVDCLAPRGRTSAVHYCMDDLLTLTLALKPRWVYGVGMHCAIPHGAGQQALQDALAQYVKDGVLKEGEVEVLELAHDGMRITLPQ